MVNRYLEKIAADYSQDRYARQLGYERVDMAGLKGAGMTLALTSPGLGGTGRNGGYGATDALWTAGNTAHSYASALDYAESQNALISQILEAQDHAIRTGNRKAFESVRYDLDEDPEGSRYAGYLIGGLGGGVMGAGVGRALTHGSTLGTVAGAGLGALGLGKLVGMGLEGLAHAHNESHASILDAREAYMKAKGMK